MRNNCDYYQTSTVLADFQVKSQDCSRTCTVPEIFMQQPGPLNLLFKARWDLNILKIGHTSKD